MKPRIKIKFVPADFWIGVYVKRTFYTTCDNTWSQFKVYICLLPMLPIIVYWEYKWSASAHEHQRLVIHHEHAEYLKAK